MSNHMLIDSYGFCGVYKDPCANQNNSQECFKDLVNSYKYYLAFENGLCRDYVSEKYWQFYDSDKLFTMNVLPVVRGAQEEYCKYSINILFKIYFILFEICSVSG